MTGLWVILYDLVFFIFICKPVDVVEGISLRASCFDGGIRNVRVGCDWFSSKSVSIFIAYNTCVGYDCENKWALVTGGLLWQWIGGHLPGCGGDGSSDVRAAF